MRPRLLPLLIIHLLVKTRISPTLPFSTLSKSSSRAILYNRGKHEKMLIRTFFALSLGFKTTVSQQTNN